MIWPLILTSMVIGEAYQKGDETLAASEPVAAAALFQRLCIAPFPDPLAFETAVSHDPAGLSEISPSETGEFDHDFRVRAAQGMLWHSESYNLRYIASERLAATVPQPQCRVTIRLSRPAEQHKHAKKIGKTLALGDGTELRAGPFLRSYWDIERGAEAPWRVMLKSESGSEGNYMSISLVKLNGTPHVLPH